MFNHNVEPAKDGGSFKVYRKKDFPSWLTTKEMHVKMKEYGRYLSTGRILALKDREKLVEKGLAILAYIKPPTKSIGYLFSLDVIPFLIALRQGCHEILKVKLLQERYNKDPAWTFVKETEARHRALEAWVDGDCSLCDEFEKQYSPQK